MSLNHRIARGIFLAYLVLFGIWVFSTCSGNEYRQEASYSLIIQNDYLDPVKVYLLPSERSPGRVIARMMPVSLDTVPLTAQEVRQHPMFRVCTGSYTGTQTDVCGTTERVTGGYENVIFLMIMSTRQFRAITVWVNG